MAIGPKHIRLGWRGLDSGITLRMYLSSGMFYEALRNLIVNELHVPTLHVLDGKEIKAAFKQVDEKTGCCGVIDPHEVSELLLLLSQEGMDLSTAPRR